MNILRNIIWKNKNNIFGKLKAGENYTFKEIEAPKGCQLAEPVKYTIKDTGEVQKVSVTDKKTPTPRCSGRFMHTSVRVIIKNVRKSVSGQGMRNESTKLCQ